MAALRQKHNNTMSEMGEQIDSLNKVRKIRNCFVTFRKGKVDVTM